MRYRGRSGRPTRLVVAALLLLVVGGAAARPGGEEPEAVVPESPEAAESRRADRTAMVERQIEARGIDDPRVLEAMRDVERHRFVPEELRDRAYADTPLPIGYGQTISQPYIVALMTALLELEAGAKVLEVGTGSGYQAAVLAAMDVQVFTLEIVPELHERTEDLFERLGYASVHSVQGDGYFGLPDEAPFDAIIVTAAVDHIPPPLLEQLAAGGRMVIPVGPAFGSQTLVVVSKTSQGRVERESVLPVRFVPMTGRAQAR